MTGPKKLTKEDVAPKKGKDKVIKGAGGGVSNNSIGKASSVQGSRPYGRRMQGPIYKMTQGPSEVPYSGPVTKHRYFQDGQGKEDN